MTDKDKPLWALRRTEHAGQCTGFGSETIWLVIFAQKPSLKVLAPFIRHLSTDMGKAISEVQTLIDDGWITLGGFDYELANVPVGTLLE